MLSSDSRPASRLVLEYVGMSPAPGSAFEPLGSERTGCEDMDNLPPGSQFFVGSPGLVIGRSPDADVKILSPYVARRHVRLWSTDEGIAAEDLGSTNGTMVNGVPVRQAILRQGDRLTIAALYSFRVVLREDS